MGTRADPRKEKILRLVSDKRFDELSREDIAHLKEMLEWGFGDFLPYPFISAFWDHYYEHVYEQAAMVKALIFMAEKYPREVGDTIAAAIEIMGLHVTEPVPQFLEAMAEKTPDKVRELIPKLFTMLEDDSVICRGNAAHALGRIAKHFPDELKRVIPRLLRMLNSEDWQERDAVVHLLPRWTKIFPGEVRAAIPQVIAIFDLESYEGKSKETAAWVLYELASDFPEEVRRTIPKIVKILLDEGIYKAPLCQILARMAGVFPDEAREEVPKLLETLGTGSAENDRDIALLLGEIGDPRAIDALSQLLDKEDNVGVVYEDSPYNFHVDYTTVRKTLGATAKEAIDKIDHQAVYLAEKVARSRGLALEACSYTQSPEGDKIRVSFYGKGKDVCKVSVERHTHRIIEFLVHNDAAG